MVILDNLYFHYSSHLNHNEDYKIKVVSESNYSKDQIISLVLDVFDMDLTEFNQKLSNYNFTKDIKNQSLDKPYLVQDRLKDVILV